METRIKPKAPGALCHECPLYANACAQTTGPKDAKLAVVSRSPGYHESISGQSFSGPSGKVLDHLLQLQGMKREDVIATNVVLCATDDPPERAVMACNGRLESEIQDADTVIAAGVEAAYALLGLDNVGRNRGYPHVRQLPSGKRQRIIVTNNPAVVLRDDGSFPELVRDFRLAINPLPKPSLPSVKIIDDVEEAKAAVTEMLGIFESSEGLLIASDIEARGVTDVKKSGLAHTAEIVCAGFSIRTERAVVFGEKPCLDESFRKGYLRKLYEVPGVRYVWHNGKYDIKILRTNGIKARVDEDTMLLSWCLDERPGDPESGAAGHSLEWLLKDELGWPKYEPETVKDFKKTGIIPNPVARRGLYEYNGMDTAGTLALYPILEERAKNDNVWDRPYKFMLLRLSEALTKVELEGMLFDSEEACNILEYEVWPKLRDLRRNARELSKKPALNLNSPKQLGELYYDEWGLKHNLTRPKIERKGKRSTDAKVREQILVVGDYKVNEVVVHPNDVARFTKYYDDFKSLDKQRGTYFEGLILRRFPNGRIYTDFKIHGTESGRLSGNNPNLQNVTRPKEGLPTIRSAFLADPGCVLVSADLSQAELRAIAVLSGDTNLQSVYLDTNRSLHKEVATEFYGENYTYEQYVKAKNINFGVAYWQSAYSFSQLYHMPVEEAQKFIDFWWARFPQVWEWTKSIEKLVMGAGEIQSPFGHKRRFYVIPADQSGQMHVVKEGINFLPQNIAGNVTNYAMIRLCEDLDWDKAQVRINVHDNLVLNVRQEFLEEIAAQTKQYMEAAVKEAIGWEFPFKAEVSYGENWGHLQELPL